MRENLAKAMNNNMFSRINLIAFVSLKTLFLFFIINKKMIKKHKLNKRTCPVTINLLALALSCFPSNSFLYEMSFKYVFCWTSSPFDTINSPTLTFPLTLEILSSSVSKCKSVSFLLKSMFWINASINKLTASL